MKKIYLFFCLLTFALVANAKTVYVSPSGDNSDGSTWEKAYTTIAAAISAATTASGDEIWVQQGTYTLTAPITMKDNISLYGGFIGTEETVEERAKVANGKPWEFAHATVLDGNNAYRIIHATAEFTEPTVIDGFTITNGNGAGTATVNGSGGGVVLRKNTILQHCIVKNCTATGGGGGVMLNAGGTINSCLIKNNSYTTVTSGNSGGGVYSAPTSSSDAYIENSEITGNTSATTGAGIRNNGTGITHVRNCKIYNNTALNGTTYLNGAAIFANNANMEIANNVIFNNSGANAVHLNAGVFVNNTVVNNVGGVYITAGSATGKVINNIVWGCTTSAGANTGITGASITNLPVQNNATYNAIPTDKNYDISDNITFSSNTANNGNFTQITSFIGAIDASVTTGDDYIAAVAELETADWSLPATSICVNQGQNIASVTSDIAATSRPQGPKFDIGAYELPYYDALVIAAGDASKNKSHYTLNYRDILFHSTDAATAQLTLAEDLPLNTSGIVKVTKTFTPRQWYTIGFPFAVTKVTADFGTGEEELDYYTGTTGDFHLKSLDADADRFTYVSSFAANQGYIIQFPIAFAGVPVTFHAAATPTLKATNATFTANPASDYELVANPSTANVTTLNGVKTYYTYDEEANRFTKVAVADDYAVTLKPFDAVLVAKSTVTELRSSIGTDNDGTTNMNTPNGNDPVVATKYYNLVGAALRGCPTTGVYIVKQIHESGKTTIMKQIK
jgi:hypothetical protein